jgi:hypothetical protein
MMAFRLAIYASPLIKCLAVRGVKYRWDHPDIWLETVGWRKKNTLTMLHIFSLREKFSNVRCATLAAYRVSKIVFSPWVGRSIHFTHFTKRSVRGLLTEMTAATVNMQCSLGWWWLFRLPICASLPKNHTAKRDWRFSLGPPGIPVQYHSNSGSGCVMNKGTGNSYICSDALFFVSFYHTAS